MNAKGFNQLFVIGLIFVVLIGVFGFLFLMPSDAGVVPFATFGEEYVERELRQGSVLVEFQKRSLDVFDSLSVNVKEHPISPVLHKNSIGQGGECASWNQGQALPSNFVYAYFLNGERIGTFDVSPFFNVDNSVNQGRGAFGVPYNLISDGYNELEIKQTFKQYRVCGHGEFLSKSGCALTNFPDTYSSFSALNNNCSESKYSPPSEACSPYFSCPSDLVGFAPPPVPRSVGLGSSFVDWGTTFSAQFYKEPLLCSVPSGFSICNIDLTAGTTITRDQLKQRCGGMDVETFCHKLPLLKLSYDVLALSKEECDLATQGDPFTRWNEEFDACIRGTVIEQDYEAYDMLVRGDYITVPAGQLWSFYAITETPEFMPVICDSNHALYEGECIPLPSLIHYCTSGVWSDEHKACLQTVDFFGCLDPDSTLVIELPNELGFCEGESWSKITLEGLEKCARCEKILPVNWICPEGASLGDEECEFELQASCPAGASLVQEGTVIFCVYEAETRCAGLLEEQEDGTFICFTEGEVDTSKAGEGEAPPTIQYISMATGIDFTVVMGIVAVIVIVFIIIFIGIIYALRR